MNFLLAGACYYPTPNCAIRKYSSSGIKPGDEWIKRNRISVRTRQSFEMLNRSYDMTSTITVASATTRGVVGLTSVNCVQG